MTMQTEKESGMKKSSVLFYLVIFTLCTLYVCPAVCFAGEKGYVELRTLFDKYEKTKDADKKLSDLAAKKQEERDALVADIRRMKDEMVVLADAGEEKVKKQAEIDQKIKELQSFDETTRAELRKIRDANVQEIFADLNGVIADYGKNKKYDFIFSDRALVYKEEKFNITNIILEKLNNKYKKK